ncbi:AI-2E family transporter [Mycobacterium sp. CBMA293]|uniref:AI-2E family transporter n=1 Tax=unclassified Mycolicibacterium TaxID=2636767 RepID=UPI0012DFABC0|nr:MULTISPECIES: AI-2E family transporter [unclassified Mycolicibacterium]MUL45811.1 AI-2E family transporter [Mycolicibacterium sp. CBMA 360]MUL60483.1 AI-2E family transporter [Mycolicibacterium sp. CBMA 335]MUL72298.1 AI-2E family transporter [Mycolicibacterium sp. CBMA 311]MUL95301.1 AI-2E family transporter [Mycolicibacterium sp. CBMA 230]MUM06879.1 AI-2E family transporter [Mycolicibacterium sp. CBMA 213]
MDTEFTVTQKRALAVATVMAVGFGAYFLRGQFILVVVASVVAYLFTPLFRRLSTRLSTGLSATLTLLTALVAVIAPISGAVALGIAQISSMIGNVSDWVSRTDMGALGTRTLQAVNDLLAQTPYLHNVTLTHESIQKWIVTFAQRAGQWGLNVLQDAAGGLFGALTGAVIFLYVFISLLVNGDAVLLLIRRLNPLGEEVTDLYLAKMGAMVRGTVRGQFVIALCQGVAGAVSIYIAGFHDGFFIFAILLTALSVIPLGGGIVTIPFGIGMALFGNVIGGVFVVAFHILVVTNIDNVLRPVLVPREARLDSALMLLAVFSGISMFGFLGLVIGPVLMIVVVTTISVYLAVFKGVPLSEPEPDEPRPPDRLARLITAVRARRTRSR